MSPMQRPTERVRIVRTPGVVSGKPRLDGTRWPTETVIGWDWDRTAMLRAYDHLTPDQIDAAIRYERTPRRVMGRKVQRWRLRLGRWIAGDQWGDDDDWEA